MLGRGLLFGKHRTNLRSVCRLVHDSIGVYRQINCQLTAFGMGTLCAVFGYCEYGSCVLCLGFQVLLRALYDGLLGCEPFQAFKPFCNIVGVQEGAQIFNCAYVLS